MDEAALAKRGLDLSKMHALGVEGCVMGLVVDLHGEALLKLFADAFSAMRPLLARGRSDDCEGESVCEREKGARTGDSVRPVPSTSSENGITHNRIGQSSQHWALLFTRTWNV